MNQSGLWDCLAHLDDPRVDDADTLLERAAKAGVTHVVCAATRPSERPRCATHPRVKIHQATGLHPTLAGSSDVARELNALDHALGEDRLIAIGEIGLDRRPGMPALDVQRQVFREQLVRARAFGLPILLHAVRATGATFDMLDDFPEVRGVVHGFTGAPEVAAAFVARGFRISFGIPLTFARNHRARAAAAAIPQSSILVESDTPEHPRADEGTSPAAVTRVIEAIARMRRAPVEQIAAATAKNAHALFRI